MRGASPMGFQSLPLMLASVLAAALLGGAPEVARAQGGRAARAASKTQMGEALVRANNPGSAVAYFREAILIDPRHERAYVALGELYRAQGRDSDALAVVRAGLRRRPRSVPLTLLFAAILEPSDPAESARLLRRAAASNPQSVPVWRALGALARAQGTFAEALAAYRAVVRLTEGDDARGEQHREARQLVAALRLLVREVDPPSRCEDSEVRQALCER